MAMRIAVPLGADPATDLDDHSLMELAVEAAHDLAATRNLHAVDVRFEEKASMATEDGGPERRFALFSAKAIGI